MRDIVKAYYDKKSGKRDLTYTAKDGQPAVVPIVGFTPAMVVQAAQTESVKSDAKER